MVSEYVKHPDVEGHREAVLRVIEAMRSRLEEPFSLRGMARVALISPFHFNRTFRRLTGIPPVQFLYALRLEMAQKLLLSTDRQVLDVCYDVGYSSHGTFTRRFTELVGVSPTRLRSLHSMGLSLHEAEPPPDSDSTRCASGRVSGTVTAPADFRGTIFAGLFREPIPQRRPVSCAVLNAPGTFRIDGVPDGTYYLFGMGIGDSTECPDPPLRAGPGSISIENGCVEGVSDLSLRQQAPLDPPILCSIPALVHQAASTRPVLNRAATQKGSAATTLWE